MTCDRSVGFAGTPVSSTNKTDTPWYNWNIVESDIEHHKPKSKPVYHFVD